MADSSSHSLLPAFGIRALNGPEAPPGIVQITAHQYDHTVRSVPDAMLFYMDEDDGEFITVGSAFELGQRLDEPAKHSTISTPAALSTSPSLSPTSEARDGMMHIFDIQRNTKSLAVWKNYHAYTSNKISSGDTFSDRGTVDHPHPHPHPRSRSRSASPQRQSPANYARSASPQPQSAVHGSDPDSSMSPRPAYPVQSSQTVETDRPNVSPVVSTHTSDGVVPTQLNSGRPVKEISTELDNALLQVFNGFGAHLGPIADFLEITASGLRKIAETKTEPSPVEGVLSGFKGILSDVGELGLELLSAIDQELEEQKVSPTTNVGLPAPEPAKPRSSLTPSPVRGNGEIQPKAETMAKRVSFFERSPSPPESNLHPVKVTVASDQKCFGSNGSEYLSSAQKPMGMSSELPRREDSRRQAPRTVETAEVRAESSNPSILDLEPSEPDFSARYPPLLSVRKAKSVSGLRDKSQSASPFGPTGTNTVSALTRYPSIGQFEQQSRLRSRARLEEKTSFTDNAVVRVSSPDTAPKPKPTGSLPRRYHTVSGTNPAARLNGPFDPLAPLVPTPVGITSRAEYKPQHSTTLARPRPTAGDGQPRSDIRNSTIPPKFGIGDWAFSGKFSGLRQQEGLSRAQTTNSRYRPMVAPSPKFTTTRARHADLFRPSYESLATGPPEIRPSTDLGAFGPAPPVPTHARPPQSGSLLNTQAQDYQNNLGPGWPLSTAADSRPRLWPVTTPSPYTRPVGRSGSVVPPPSSTTAVRHCVKNLKEMGYGTMDHNEMSRLNMYASAAAGDLEAAIEMIEEDREAVKSLAEGQGLTETLDSASQRLSREV